MKTKKGRIIKKIIGECYLCHGNMYNIDVINRNAWGTHTLYECSCCSAYSAIKN